MLVMTMRNIIDILERIKELRLEIGIYSFYLPTLLIERLVLDSNVFHYPTRVIIFGIWSG